MIRDVRTYDDPEGRIVVMRMDADTGETISYTGKVVLQREDYLESGQVTVQPILKNFPIQATGIKDAFKKFDIEVDKILRELRRETAEPKIKAAAADAISKLEGGIVLPGGGG